MNISPRRWLVAEVQHEWTWNANLRKIAFPLHVVADHAAHSDAWALILSILAPNALYNHATRHGTGLMLLRSVPSPNDVKAQQLDS